MSKIVPRSSKRRVHRPEQWGNGSRRRNIRNQLDADRIPRQALVKQWSLRSVQIKLIKTGGSRRKRIARVSGTAPADVNRLLNQFQ